MDINWQKHGVEAFSYLKGIGNKVKQVALQLTEIEVKVEDATNNEPWGPHGKDMAGERANIVLIHHQFQKWLSGIASCLLRGILACSHWVD